MLEDYTLKVFDAVARNRSFTAAARELDVTQPAVSQKIAELEKSLGAELFTRSRSSVSLTPEGEVFMYYARRIMKGYEDLNTVFGNYEAFVSILDQCRDLAENPLYQSLKDTILK
jgi:DNA-binding transcriptional LysR family regulator